MSDMSQNGVRNARSRTRGALDRGRTAPIVLRPAVHGQADKTQDSAGTPSCLVRWVPTPPTPSSDAPLPCRTVPLPCRTGLDGLDRCGHAPDRLLQQGTRRAHIQPHKARALWPKIQAPAERNPTAREKVRRRTEVQTGAVEPGQIARHPWRIII